MLLIDSAQRLATDTHLLEPISGWCSFWVNFWATFKLLSCARQLHLSSAFGPPEKSKGLPALKWPEGKAFEWWRSRMMMINWSLIVAKKMFVSTLTQWLQSKVTLSLLAEAARSAPTIGFCLRANNRKRLLILEALICVTWADQWAALSSRRMEMGRIEIGIEIGIGIGIGRSAATCRCEFGVSQMRRHQRDRVKRWADQRKRQNRSEWIKWIRTKAIILRPVSHFLYHCKEFCIEFCRATLAFICAPTSCPSFCSISASDCFVVDVKAEIGGVELWASLFSWCERLERVSNLAREKCFCIWLEKCCQQNRLIRFPFGLQSARLSKT